MPADRMVRPVLLEHLRPNHNIGDARLGFDRDEHESFGRPCICRIRIMPAALSQRPSRDAIGLAQATMRR